MTSRLTLCFFNMASASTSVCWNLAHSCDKLPSVSFTSSGMGTSYFSMIENCEHNHASCKGKCAYQCEGACKDWHLVVEWLELGFDLGSVGVELLPQRQTVAQFVQRLRWLAHSAKISRDVSITLQRKTTTKQQ